MVILVWISRVSELDSIIWVWATGLFSFFFLEKLSFIFFYGNSYLFVLLDFIIIAELYYALIMREVQCWILNPQTGKCDGVFMETLQVKRDMQ
jgi:hypothetical protein